MKRPKFSIIILAAGNSSRMGKPKQLLETGGKTLIRRVADEAVKSGANEIIVITGEIHGQICAALSGLNVKITHNSNWRQGMASSIKSGINQLSNDKVIICVTDQPYVTADLFSNLAAQQAGIAASIYAGTLGTPVAFSKKYFPNLLALKNDEGAKKIILTNLDDVAKVSFPQGEIDIDTPEDYSAYSGGK